MSTTKTCWMLPEEPEVAVAVGAEVGVCVGAPTTVGVGEGDGVED